MLKSLPWLFSKASDVDPWLMRAHCTLLTVCVKAPDGATPAAALVNRPGNSTAKGAAFWKKTVARHFIPAKNIFPDQGPSAGAGDRKTFKLRCFRAPNWHHKHPNFIGGSYLNSTPITLHWAVPL
ncbi:hypothetical protein [Microbulbifer discodermiae]|uniref:hypothetical protein n=1 Tax=Microbulbifer sp. 2201CG32-9 TaxID=3232309 RepID=UPI00345BB00A